MGKVTSRTSRFQKRLENQKKIANKIKEEGADSVFGNKPYVPTKRQISRHGINKYKDAIAVTENLKTDVINNANVDTASELTVPVGDKFATSDDGYVIQKKVERIQNPLHKFNTQNAVFTLAALTLDEVNYPDETLFGSTYVPQHIVAKSAGGSSRDSNLAKEPLQLEFYIDNVQIEAIIHSNTKTGHTQGTNITFSVHEPFSLGLFLQNLQLQVAKASRSGDDQNMASYLTHPMVLILEFKGTTDMPLTDDELRQLRKVMPIRLNKVNFASNNGVSQYEVEAVALNDVAFADQYAQLPVDVELRGETVQEILFSGKQSLSAILNDKQVAIDKSNKNLKGRNKTRQMNKKPNKNTLQKVNSPRDYIFLFPENVGFAQGIINQGVKNTPTTVDIVEQGGGGGGDVGPVYVDYSKRIQGIFGGLFQNFDYTFEEGFSGEQIKINDIGKSKMVIDHLQNAADTGKQFADDDNDTSTYYIKESKTPIKSTAKIDTKNKTISFKKGMHLTQIIEEVILLSEYGQDIAKRKKAAPDGMIQWFKIVPARYMFQDRMLQMQFNTYPEIVMFRIIPYNVPDDKFMAPDEVSRADLLDDFIRKEYNILYKGTNKDVIDFNVEFNQAFYSALMNDYGNNSGDSQDNSNSSVSTDKSVVGQSSATSSYGGTTVNQQIAFGDPTNVQGGNIETVELRIARQFNKAILDSAVDLVKLDLNIVGDPYFLPQTGFGNYVGHSPDVSTEQFTDQDKAADFLRGIVLTKVNFRTPLDIGADGTMLFNKDTVSETNLQVLGEFSGYYYPITVRSSFSGNKFTQEIELIRNKTGVIDPSKTGTDNEPALDVMDEISKDASVSLNDDPYQGGTHP